MSAGEARVPKRWREFAARQAEATNPDRAAVIDRGRALIAAGSFPATWPIVIRCGQGHRIIAMTLFALPSGNPGISAAAPTRRAGHTLYTVATGPIDDPAVTDNKVTFTCPAHAHGKRKPSFPIRYRTLLADTIAVAVAGGHDVFVGATPKPRR